MRWIIYFFLAIACVAADEGAVPSLTYLMTCFDDCPKELVLKEAVQFKFILNGKEMGSVRMPPETKVKLVRIKDEGLEVATDSGNTAIVSIAQTNFMALWKAPKPKNDDPIFLLCLPENSQAKEWYKIKIEAEIDPWLNQNQTHPLRSKVEEIKKTFQKDFELVESGRLRVGNVWIPKGQEDEWRKELEASSLLQEIQTLAKKSNIDELLLRLSEVKSYSDTSLYPLLVRTSHEIVNNCTASYTCEKESERLENQKSESEKKMLALEAELKEELKVYAVEGSKSPKPGYGRFQDGLYRPSGRYCTAGHFGSLKPYMPEPDGCYEEIPSEKLEEYNKKFAKIVELQNAIAQLESNKVNAARGVESKKAQLMQIMQALPIKEIENKEIALAHLKNIDRLSPMESEAVLGSLLKTWPGNLPTCRACLDKVAIMQTEIENCLKYGKIDEAKRILASSEKLLSNVDMKWSRLVSQVTSNKAFKNKIKDALIAQKKSS